MKHFWLIIAVFFSVGAMAQSTVIPGFVGGLHQGGNLITETVDFPADVSNFSQVLMEVSLDCPAGGCDPWDRFANLSIEVGGQTIEIGRYVTPYGNDWCSWTIDVSEYRHLLTGTKTISSKIDTWENGWLVNTEFEFVPGTPDYEFVHVQNLWVDDNFEYGDTVFFSINLPEIVVPIPDNAEEVIMRVVNTGHGQGNTDNAAEFSQKTHAVHVNGSEVATHFLWKSDCESNPCSPQGGTWQFDRAGWCPGQGVTPFDVDLTNDITPGQSATLDYVLEPFFNECSPWNLACVVPTTCAECTYNSNGHTEPHYKMAIQLIIKSSTPLDIVSVTELAEADGTRVYPNPSNGTFNFEMAHADFYQVAVTDVAGRLVTNTSFNGQFHQLDLLNQQPGLYFVVAKSASRTYSKKLMIQK